jgi:hypothetical protein
MPTLAVSGLSSSACIFDLADTDTKDVKVLPERSRSLTVEKERLGAVGAYLTDRFAASDASGTYKLSGNMRWLAYTGPLRVIWKLHDEASICGQAVSYG